MTRVRVLKGITATKLPVAPTEEELIELESRVERAAPKDAENFAFVVGRNWAIDAARRASAQQRRLAEEAARRVVETEKERAFAAFRDEAHAIIDRLNPNVTPAQRVQLQLAWWKVFEGKSAEECGNLLPGTQRDGRVKSFQRGRVLLMQNASPELKAFLNHRVSMKGGVTATPLPG